MDGLHPFDKLADRTLHIADVGLDMHLDPSNIIRLVTMENDIVNDIFRRIGNTKLNIYNSEKEFMFTKDSKGLDLGNPQIRNSFYNSVISVPNVGFMEFIFENPALSLGLNSGGSTRVENMTRYLVEREDIDFVS